MTKGDLVRLKVGSTVMVIDSVEGEEAECVWLKMYEQIRGKFSLDALELVPSIDLTALFQPSCEEI